MDRITQSFLDEFVKEHALERFQNDKQFEHFASYLSVRRHYNGDAFETDEIVTGSGGDTSIDGLVIIVNGSIITDVEILEDHADLSGNFDVTFIFVQAKRSSSFDSAKIGNFGFGVKDFFSSTPQLVRNEMIANAAETMDVLYSRYGSRFKPGNPECYLYYITTGTWTGDVNLEARRVNVEDDLRSMQIFRKVNFSCMGASDVQNLYRHTKNKVTKEFTFANRTLLPEIEGVSEAYLGYVPLSEFMSIVKDDDDSIIHSIFYDNVRDWQDYNDVNSEIRKTLQTNERTRFVVMNNGITIISRSMRKLRGDKLQIEDFQIVNGCQTSHVLFDQRNSINDNVSIPLRLIATSDDSVINSIVRATNRQTKVDEEQFFALTDFAEKLESYFQTFQDHKKLYYERRSRQYAHLQLQNTKIITHGNLVRAVASMFLEIPHQTTRSYKSLKERIGRDMFVEGHRLEPYYVAAFALYRLESYFKGVVDTKLKPARFHVLLAVRIISNPGNMPRMNSHEMERHCNAIMELLWDSNRSEEFFKKAAEVVAEVAAGNYHRDNIRTQPFTDQIMKRCRDSIPVRTSTTVAPEVENGAN